MWVAVGYGQYGDTDNGHIKYSYDGISWSDSVGGTSFSTSWMGCCLRDQFRDGTPMWMAVGVDTDDNGNIMYSYDGISWSDSVGGTSFINEWIRDIAYGMSLFGRVTQITEKAHPKVTSLSATVIRSLTRLNLSWTAPPGVTVTGYEIERSENDESNYESNRNNRRLIQQRITNSGLKLLEYNILLQSKSYYF